MGGAGEGETELPCVHSGEKDPLVPLQSQDALKAAGEAAERTGIQPQQVFQTGPPAAFLQEGKEGIKAGVPGERS